MRKSTILILSLLFSSCIEIDLKADLQGLWVAIAEDESQTGIIDFQEDSIVLYPHFGMSYKAAYTIDKNSIELSAGRQIQDTGFSEEGETIQFTMYGDTLHWNNQFKFLKSPYNSYVEHYANSKGLSIELPASSSFTRTDLNSYYFLEFFIGFQKDGSTRVLINDEPAEYFKTYERIKQLQDSVDYTKTIGCRIFADKNTDIMYIHDIHTTMRRMGILPIHYVTTNAKRHPYDNDFSGIKILIHERIIEEEKDI